ncbi:MAG: hypothetical protein Q8M58_00710, partial [Anaerolineales bacterium]|nr:hypothetical protein [Anaerolineales bacterium]
VTEESKKQLAESAAPPIRLVAVKAGELEVKAGNETVLFRHEKTFFNKPGLFVKVKASAGADAMKAEVAKADAYKVNYVGIELTVDGFAVEADGGDASTPFVPQATAARRCETAGSAQVHTTTKLSWGCKKTASAGLEPTSGGVRQRRRQ